MLEPVQLHLPMLTYYQGPRFVSAEVMAGVLSYRDAVRACWQLRTRRSLTLRQLAEEATLYASHVSDYVSADDAKRELPAKHVDAFEIACGNRVITQWDMARKHLTVLESLIEQRRAA